ncbi:UNVERIFIED_CONTAM: hypothetical protein NCL1_38102 [Trichonephila clavipes]
MAKLTTIKLEEKKAFLGRDRDKWSRSWTRGWLAMSLSQVPLKTRRVEEPLLVKSIEAQMVRTI